MFAKVPEYFSEFAVVPVQYHDAGDVVTVEGRTIAVSKRGGRFDEPTAWVFTLRDGKVVRCVNYHDTAAWKTALLGE